MRFTIAVVLAAASVAVAQSSTGAAPAAPTSNQICAQNIVDACVDQYDRQVEKCGGNDYICLCDGYTNKLTCYNNCMGSEDRPPVQNQVTQFCLAAAPLSSASIASAKSAMSRASAAAATAATSSAAETTATDASATPTVASASGFGSENTGAAVAMQVPMGGAVAVLLGLAGLL
ncbi:hypothetical protein BU23DRAFT_556747 [Bimuria novae-zelandiae CBS 107.79]|uniref:Extracellular membrane protein CFEM domain-containing protein n=1 Tax=Bimuria novae-zelandiae CBS 107.79 TaxID=1447943 RepID=A0A6A5V0J1_9PLEO|nr:hypothetical protein BU23DRAFT_556747 [Bimuria novae-zelandiae CBS 107.79]